MQEKVTKQLTAATVLIMVPFVLLAGSLLGYAAGSWVSDHFKAGSVAVFSGIALGFTAGAIEVQRLIKFAMRLDKDTKD